MWVTVGGGGITHPSGCSPLSYVETSDHLPSENVPHACLCLPQGNQVGLQPRDPYVPYEPLGLRVPAAQCWASVCPGLERVL